MIGGALAPQHGLSSGMSSFPNMDSRFFLFFKSRSDPKIVKSQIKILDWYYPVWIVPAAPTNKKISFGSGAASKVAATAPQH